MKVNQRVLWSFVLLFSTVICYSQSLVIPQVMTRPKMWIKANPNGSLERENTMTYEWELAYPGYWGHRNEASGGWDGNAIYNGAQVAGEDVCWMYRNGNYDDADIFAIVPSAINRNYNMMTSLRGPEEYITGTIGSPKLDSRGKRHMGYTLEGTIMGWSQPKYDDFLVIKCKLTNVDDSMFHNFYYTRYFSMPGPYHPTSVSPGWDVEYMWDTTVSKDIGFIFYDDTSIPPVGDPPQYSIPPGNVTGNAGDPGNIGQQNSQDMKLYSPSLYAYSFLPQYITPNKYGQRKVWRTIVSGSGNAPPEELMPSWTSELTVYSRLVDFITNNEQPEVSWRDAHANYQPGNKAGSLYERNPKYFYSIGPYDIAPGQSIEWIEILLCGAMDRNITIKGDTTATKHFVEEGLKNLKDNWNAAKSMIASGYRYPANEVPPPTPASAPNTGSFNGLGTANPELLVETSAKEENGQRIPGVNITWNAVHVGYLDPGTRKADFKEYKIYRSDNSIEGPWDSIAAVSRIKADSLVVGGKITYFVPAMVGIPYRYCVTSIDTSGFESAKSGYSFYPKTSEPNPSNNANDIVVVPNPFRQVSGYADQTENKRLAFMNIPAKCTIRIYTVALDLIRTIEHDGAGLATWGTQTTQDYMLTEFGQNVMPGVYIFQVESHVPGHDGETAVGKFAIIK